VYVPGVLYTSTKEPPAAPAHDPSSRRNLPELTLIAPGTKPAAPSANTGMTADVPPVFVIVPLAAFDE
jgi:hypothetical protein